MAFIVIGRMTLAMRHASDGLVHHPIWLPTSRPPENAYLLLSVRPVIITVASEPSPWRNGGANHIHML
ncbi:developmental protein FluG [Anopheles sinensis]|uniref:Developmental protein FluG n=1 Tax=Anopheles sinensis TaxID=74873 RepID=A0A084W6E7_ANOSI|nr:developmental protein FluG [Anopheles sinensis]